jgi:Concanavalin A-like lectin/glucanases superfamily
MKAAPDALASRSTRFWPQKSVDRRWHRAFLSAIAVAFTGLVACQSNDGEERADLNAILEDGDLNLVIRGPLSVGGTGGAGAGGSGPIDGGGPGGGTPDAGVAGAVGTDGPFPGPGGGPGRGDGGFGDDGGIRQPFPQFVQGLWQFDDCNSFRTDLNDSSFNFHPAFRSVSAACTTGIQAQGIAIDEADDLVYVPDQPSFTFDSGVTVAAWVNPTRLGGVRTIFRKRENGTSTFVLLQNGKDYQFVIRLTNGRAAEVRARATLDTFTHVAATYDGNDLRLYLNGSLAAHTRVNGRLSNGAGPLLMGNDARGRRIDGVLDNVLFDTQPATPEQILRLNCLPRPSTLVATPVASGLVPPGTPVDYDVQFTNNSCDPQQLQFNAFGPNPSLLVNPSFDFRTADPGATAHIQLTVSSSPDIEPDDYPISISVFSFQGEFLSTSVLYSVQGTPCSVRSRRELEIRDLSVVEDPVRTAPGGAWTFGKLMEDMAPSAAAAPAMVESLLGTWLTDQSVNGFRVAARPGMQDLILGPFPRTASGELDLGRAPFRLLAIVNRIDLQDVSRQSAGEGRFVFGVLDSGGNPLSLTMILEYNIPAASAQDVTDLANAWHGLSSLPFPSEQYNAALQAITDRFAGRNVAPGRVNGNAIGQVRTNDFFTLGEWEFREFHLSAATGTLTPATLALTPDRSFNGTQTLTDYINANEPSILTQTHTVPETFAGQPFQAGSMITDFFVWQAPGVNPEARAKFALNTCNGCHTNPLESNVFVFQVSPRSQGQESSLSPFLLGTQTFDGFANVIRVFNELGRRGRILHGLVCPNDPLPPPPPDTIPVNNPDGGAGDAGMGGSDGGSGGSRDAIVRPPPPRPF